MRRNGRTRGINRRGFLISTSNGSDAARHGRNADVANAITAVTNVIDVATALVPSIVTTVAAFLRFHGWSVVIYDASRWHAFKI